MKQFTVEEIETKKATQQLCHDNCCGEFDRLMIKYGLRIISRPQSLPMQQDLADLVITMCRERSNDNDLVNAILMHAEARATLRLLLLYIDIQNGF